MASKKTNAERDRRDVRLSFLLQDVARLQKRAFDRIMSPLGITRTQWLVVATLSRHDGMTQTQLATMLDIGKANLGALLDDLRDAALVEIAPHPVDGRANSVYLSKQGQKLVLRMREAERGYTEHTFADLTDAEREQLGALLARVKRSLAQPEDD